MEVSGIEDEKSKVKQERYEGEQNDSDSVEAPEKLENVFNQLH
jgi:hypothetical protein